MPKLKIIYIGLRFYLIYLCIRCNVIAQISCYLIYIFSTSVCDIKDILLALGKILVIS